ncbi:MAG: rod shape-determining protein MreD [Alphaproteobacteria bacterium]
MKLNYFKIACACFFLFFIQTHPFLPTLKQGLRPDLVLIFVVFSGINFSFLRGSLLCFFVGFCMECLSGAANGFFSTIYLCIFITIKFLLRFFSFDSLKNCFFLFFACVFIKAIFLFVYFPIINEFDFHVFCIFFIKETIFTLCFFPIVFYFLKKTGFRKIKRSDNVFSF